MLLINNTICIRVIKKLHALMMHLLDMESETRELIRVFIVASLDGGGGQYEL